MMEVSDKQGKATGWSIPSGIVGRAIKCQIKPQYLLFGKQQNVSSNNARLTILLSGEEQTERC